MQATKDGDVKIFPRNQRHNHQHKGGGKNSQDRLAHTGKGW